MKGRTTPLAAAAAMLALTLSAPFAAAESSKPGTLGTLKNRQPDLDPETPAPPADADPARAREAYQRVLQLAQNDPRHAAEALRRLADLELEAAGSGDTEAERQAHYRKAQSLYEDWLRRYPDEAHADAVLYQLAQAQEGGGAPLAAIATLERLGAAYPQSPLMPDVQFRSGELLFAQKRYAPAEAAYGRVLAFGQSTPYYEQALYKQGWSRFKRDAWPAELDPFFQLLDGHLGAVPAREITAHLDALPRPQRELIDDSLRVMALAIVAQGGGDGSLRALREQLARHGEPVYADWLYRSLSDSYLEQKRYTDAAGALTAFVDDHPQHPQAPAFYMQAVDALQAGKLEQRALALRGEYTRRFALDQPYWSNPDTVATRAAARDYLRESLWLTAQQHHALAQAPNAGPDERRTDSAAAADAYARYVEDFPQDARAPQALFLLGDLRSDGGDLSGAIGAYEDAAYRYPDQPRAADAGYASLVAYQKHEAELAGAAQAEWRARRVAAELRYADRFPNDPRATPARAEAAAALFEAGQSDAALAAAERVVADPAAADAPRRIAWRVIGHASFDRQDYVRAEHAYRELQKLAAADAKPDPQIGERLTATIYRRGEQARDAGQPLQAAGLFAQAAAEAPVGSELRAKADYDAAMATLAGGQRAQAIPQLLAFRSHYPGHPLVASVTQTLAVAYQDEGRPLEAAAEFQRIADTPGTDDAVRAEALWRAGELAAPQDPVAAERAYAQYVQRYPQNFEQSVEARQRLLELAQRRGDAPAAQAAARALVAYEAGG
ncbi:MAG: tetratricopeptide repeat protein, partial [Solimonas sp.]